MFCAFIPFPFRRHSRVTMTASPLIPTVRSGRIYKMRPYNERGRQVRL